MISNPLSWFTEQITQSLLEQPQIAWLIGHPGQAIGLSFLVFFLLWGLLKALTSLIEKIWILLLKAPFQIAKSLLDWLSKPLIKLWQIKFNQNSSSEVSLTEENPATRLKIIFDRLQEIKQEQNVLLEELRAILDKQSANN